MSTFTEEELRLFSKTINVREKIIDKLLTLDLPTKPREVESFVNLLESVDRSLISRKKVIIEDSAQKSDSESKEILKTLMLSLHNGEVIFNDKKDESKLTPEYVTQEIEISEGELVNGHDPAIEQMISTIY